MERRAGSDLAAAGGSHGDGDFGVLGLEVGAGVVEDGDGSPDGTALAPSAQTFRVRVVAALLVEQCGEVFGGQRLPDPAEVAESDVAAAVVQLVSASVVALHRHRRPGPTVEGVHRRLPLRPPGFRALEQSAAARSGEKP